MLNEVLETLHVAFFCIIYELLYFFFTYYYLLIFGMKSLKTVNDSSFLVIQVPYLSNTNFSIMQILMVNIIISLLHMDNLSLNSMHCQSPGSDSKLSDASSCDHGDPIECEGGNKMVVSFTGLLLDILRENILSSAYELENTLEDGVSADSMQALDWRISIAKRFIEEWEWRLSILQRLLPFSDRKWKWKEALTVLRAAPSKLLNL